MIHLETITDKDRFWGIFQSYLREMAQFYGDEPDGEGTYPYPYFDRYFADAPDRKALYIMEDGAAVGFALLNRHSFTDAEIDHAIAEFSVFPAHRERGCGAEAARCIFARLPGRWQVKYSRKNTKAARFWTKVTRQFRPRVMDLGEDERLALFSAAPDEAG